MSDKNSKVLPQEDIISNETFSPDRMYTYLKGYTAGAGLANAEKALVFAKQHHAGQTRKNGSPYFIHPMTMACHAAALGIKDDAIIAACLLHDVVEDCGVLPCDLPVEPRVQNIVTLLSHVKTDPLELYYSRIISNKEACLVKLLDRCDNVSTMSGV